jgi:hypothetical protein
MVGWEHVIDPDFLGTDPYQYETFSVEYPHRVGFFQGRICRECGGLGWVKAAHPDAAHLLPGLEAALFRSTATRRYEPEPEDEARDRRLWLRAACYAEEFLRLQRQLQAAREELEALRAGES